MKNRAELSQRDGVTRARITQIMKLLQLSPEIQEAILTLPLGTPLQLVSEHKFRPLVGMIDEEQIGAFRAMVGDVVTLPNRERKAG